MLERERLMARIDAGALSASLAGDGVRLTCGAAGLPERSGGMSLVES